jgi:plasmid stability protein
MATLTIRDFDDELKAALRVRAAEQGRSTEAEAREILRAALTRPSSPGPEMGIRIRQRFSGGVNAEIEPPARTERPRAAEFCR